MRSSNSRAEPLDAPRTRSTPRRSSRRTFSNTDSQSEADEPFEVKPRRSTTPQSRTKTGSPRPVGRPRKRGKGTPSLDLSDDRPLAELAAGDFGDFDGSALHPDAEDYMGDDGDVDLGSVADEPMGDIADEGEESPVESESEFEAEETPARNVPPRLQRGGKVLAAKKAPPPVTTGRGAGKTLPKGVNMPSSEEGTGAGLGAGKAPAHVLNVPVPDEHELTNFLQFPSLVDGGNWVWAQQAASQSGVLKGEEGMLPIIEYWGDDDMRCLLDELNTAKASAMDRVDVLKHLLATLNKHYPPPAEPVPRAKPPKSIPVTPATPSSVVETPQRPGSPGSQFSGVSHDHKKKAGRAASMSGSRDNKRHKIQETPDAAYPSIGDGSIASSRAKRSRSTHRRHHPHSDASDASDDDGEDSEAEVDDADLDVDGESEKDHAPSTRSHPSRSERASGNMGGKTVPGPKPNTSSEKAERKEKRKRQVDSDASDAAYTSSDEEKAARNMANAPPGLFWTIVEEYFAPLTPETLQVLESKITQNQPPAPTDPLFTVPPLGRHFTEVWADEDNTADLIEPVFDIDPMNSSIAERWIAAMTEARTLPIALQQSIEFNPENLNQPPSSIGTLQVHKAEPDLPSLEDRVRNELRTLGVLGDDEPDLKNREDDEVCQELRSVQKQLLQLTEQNAMRCSLLLRNLKPLVRPHEKLKQVKDAHAALEEAYRRRQRALKARKRKPTTGTLDDVKRALQQHAARIQAIQMGLQPGPRPQPGFAQAQRPAPSPGNATRLVITPAGLATPTTSSTATPMTYSHSFSSPSGRGGPQPGAPQSTAPQQAPSSVSTGSPGTFQKLSGRVQIRPAGGQPLAQSTRPGAVPLPNSSGAQQSTSGVPSSGLTPLHVSTNGPVSGMMAAIARPGSQAALQASGAGLPGYINPARLMAPSTGGAYSQASAGARVGTSQAVTPASLVAGSLMQQRVLPAAPSQTAVQLPKVVPAGTINPAALQPQVSSTTSGTVIPTQPPPPSA